MIAEFAFAVQVFAQADPPPPAPAPAPPGIDVGGLARALGEAIIQGFQVVLQGWADQLPNQVATNGTGLTHTMWDWLNLQGLNFVVHTPLNLVTAGGSYDVKPLMDAVVAVAFVLAAIAYAGHHWLGWPGIDQTVQRILITVVLVGSSFRLLALSMDLFNGLLSGLTAPGLNLPAGGGLPAVLTFVLGVFWFFFAFRLAILMAKRMVWLAVLYKLAPLAFMTWINPKSAWLAVLWTKLWVGYLVSQVVVVVCLIVSAAMVNLGGPAGYLLSVATLMVAHDAVKVLAPNTGAGAAISVGWGPARYNVPL